jgi:hypothetical protein
MIMELNQILMRGLAENFEMLLHAVPILTAAVENS